MSRSSRLTVAMLLAELTRRLPARSGRAPGQEATELVAALLDVPRHWPALHYRDDVPDDTWARALAAAATHARGAPLAYAVGQANFRGLTLAVDERVLIPRPETELLVDLVLGGSAGGTIVDVGTGSGALAIALATEGGTRFRRTIATDISADALDVARSNAERCGAAIELRRSDLLAAFPARPLFDVVVSNPPYVSFGEAKALPPSVRDWEPPVALFAPRDGLATTARLVRQAAVRLRKGGLLAVEVDFRRAPLVAELAASDSRYTDVRIKLDLAGRERFVLASRRSSDD